MKTKMLKKLISMACVAAMATSCAAMSVGAVKVVGVNQEATNLVESANNINNKLDLLIDDISWANSFLKDDGLIEMINFEYNSGDNKNWCNCMDALLHDSNEIAALLRNSDVTIHGETAAGNISRAIDKIRDNSVVIRQLCFQLPSDLKLSSKAKKSPTKKSKRIEENKDLLLKLKTRTERLKNDMLTLRGALVSANTAE